VENYQIALAALIHDIGKVLQRAGRNHDIDRQKSIFCKYDNQTKKYGYIHSLYTVRFIEENLREIFNEELLKVSAKHHVPETDLEKIVARADWLSAGMDRLEKADENYKKYDYKNTRLYSIFNNIKGAKKLKEKKHFYYDLLPIEISERIFPKKDEDIKRSRKESEIEYEELLKNIEEEINRIDKDSDIDKIYNQIHHIMEKYTSFIPSSTIHYPDISLYDHLRTTAAIATCLYEIYKSGEEPENEFLLLEGDVSGIQDFIYRIAEGEETKKDIAKCLRGRSAYINILIDFMSKYIIRELGHTISNILYCGGGKFQILIPNTSATKEKINIIKKKLESFLYKKYKTRISTVIDYVEINQAGIKNYASAISQLREKIEVAKNKKYLNLINELKDDFFVSNKKSKNICKYCHTNEANSTGICPECELHIKLGERLVEGRVKYIAYDFEGITEKVSSDVSVKFADLGSVNLYNSLDSNIKAFMIENINNTGLFGRPKFIGNVVPKLKENNGIASFNKLAEVSEGDDKIGILKMDIDNLGTIFTSGLGEENRGISRISTLSRMIDLFFSGYINRICKDLFEKYVEKVKNPEIDEIFYINYSGGDDLLIIGPWDWIIELSIEIRKKFEEYVCYNPNITLSAGLYICDSKTPIRMSSQEADVYLEKAKMREGKNSICIFDNAIDWFGEYSFEKSVQDAETYKKWENENKISKSLIYNIMLASKNIDLRRKRPQDFHLIPKLAYSLARNIKDENVLRELKRKLITSKIDDSEIEFIKFPLMITLLKTRTNKEG